MEDSPPTPTQPPSQDPTRRYWWLILVIVPVAVALITRIGTSPKTATPVISSDNLRTTPLPTPNDNSQATTFPKQKGSSTPKNPFSQVAPSDLPTRRYNLPEVPAIITALNGIAIGGRATVTNPTINNFGSLEPKTAKRTPQTPLELSFVHPWWVQWRITNASDESHSGYVRFSFIDFDREFIEPEATDFPLQSSPQKVDFINPGRHADGFFKVDGLLQAPATAKTGFNDRFYGLAELSCPDCKDRGYWFYFQNTRGGWFCEIKDYAADRKYPMGTIAGLSANEQMLPCADSTRRIPIQ